jgi:hypothetical protein
MGRRWVIGLVLALASCHGSHSTATNATTSEARFLNAGPRWMLVEVSQSGSLSNEVNMPVDPAVKVFVGDKQVSLRQIPVGTPVKIWRDVKTHQVVRVETVGAKKE